MQHVFPHAQTNQHTRDSEHEYHDPNPIKRILIDTHNGIPPLGAQLIDLINIIPDPPNDILGIRIITKPRPESGLEDILEHGAGDGDADGTARGAEGVRRTGDDGLVLVADGRQEREEGDRQHGAVAAAV